MRFYKPLLLKAYFDKGFGVTNYVKYIVAFYGLSSRDISLTLLWAFIYFIACFIVGWLWYKYRLTDTEVEILNRFNPFVREVRGKLRVKKLK